MCPALCGTHSGWGESWRRFLGARSARPGGADGDSGVAIEGPRRCFGEAHFAFGTKPCAVGSAPDPSRFGCAGSRAESFGGRCAGSCMLQAAIVACHARARVPEETDWERIAALYSELAHVASSPVVELIRAVAIAMAFGPAAGLELVDALTAEPSLQNYHLLPSVRGDFLFKLGDSRRLEPSSSARHRSLAMPGSASCCWSAPIKIVAELSWMSILGSLVRRTDRAR